MLFRSSSATSLSNIEGKISTMYTFFASLNDDKEEQAMEFVERNGGEEAVKNVVFFNFSVYRNTANDAYVHRMIVYWTN